MAIKLILFYFLSQISSNTELCNLSNYRPLSYPCRPGKLCTNQISTFLTFLCLFYQLNSGMEGCLLANFL